MKSKITDDENLARIADYFPVPARVADQLRHVVEKVRGGYILYETRPQWDDASAPWIKSAIAKMVWNRAAKSWTLHWMPSSMKWLRYGEYKNFGKALNVIAQDKDACFWG